MNEVLRWVEAERLSFADLLDDLADDEWGKDSLCAGWTVLDVAAHLTLSTRTTLGMVVWGAIKARGSFDRMEADLARKRATQFTRAELIEQIRATAGSDRHTPGSSLLDCLLDALVHGQDIARPLGRPRPMPLEPAIAALEVRPHEQVLRRPEAPARSTAGGHRRRLVRRRRPGRTPRPRRRPPPRSHRPPAGLTNATGPALTRLNL